MTAYESLVAVRIAAGAVALGAYWTAAAVRKGSPIHRLAGKVFLSAMLGIIATALPISIVFLVPGSAPFGIFLAFLVMITATACCICSVSSVLA